VEPLSDEIRMYTTTWCGYCVRLKRMLEDAKVDYTEVDVETDPAAAARIVAKTGGYRTVPSVEVGGAMLVNPSLQEVLEASSSN